MSTIYEFQADDTGSELLGGLNDNFDALNTDKIEADSTEALTNKTIDADLNTIQDLGTSNFKTTSKSGLDTTFITGTKGTSGNLAKWNSDGDLVEEAKSITTTNPSSSSDDTTIPTSKAVYGAINNALTTKQIYVPVIKDADTQPYLPSVLGYYAFAQLDSGETAYFNFVVPSNFNSITSIEVVMIPDSTETLTMTSCLVNISASGEAYNTHTGTGASNTLAVTADRMTFWRVDNISGTPFSTMLANDVVGVAITSSTTLMRVLGLLIKYT